MFDPIIGCLMSFLTRNILLSTIFLLGFIGSRAQVLQHITITGTIRDDAGKPLAGINVTDGTSIVDTDAKGNYRIATTSQSLFIYITLPSGFEVPGEKGIAAFYKKINADKKGKGRINFTLRRLLQNDEHHFAIVWADPQIKTPKHAQQLMEGPVPDTKQLVDELKKTGPVHGLSVGDIIWDAPDRITDYKKAVEATGIPFFQVLGNHDMDLFVRSDELSSRRYNEAFGPGWYSFNRGKAHYVVLDNVFYYGSGYNYFGYLTEQQLHWLEQDLSRVKPGSLVFVSMHIPAYTNEKRIYNMPKDEPGNITLNRKHFYQLLKPFRSHLLIGHAHTNENLEEDGVQQHIHGAVCGAWWLTDLCHDGTPMGYGVYEIKGDSLSWYYKSVGHDRSYQLKIYPPGSDTTRPGQLVANVWNYDKQWKVEWFADGIPQGSMTQGIGVDPETVRLYGKSDRTGLYDWVWPGRSEHLFYATPAPGIKKIRVQATDPFGNRYSEELDLP